MAPPLVLPELKKTLPFPFIVNRQLEIPHHSLNCSTVVSARSLPSCPPNMITSVRVEQMLIAVEECTSRGCRLSLTCKVIWTFIIVSCYIVAVHYIYPFIWHTQSANALSRDYAMCIATITVYTSTNFPHLPPPPTFDIQNPGISQYPVLSVQSPSDKQLWVLLVKIQTASSMSRPLLWPSSSPFLVEFGPVLQWQTVTSTLSTQTEITFSFHPLPEVVL